jgi:glycosyltransferase involved in cell wall biosynthesis
MNIVICASQVPFVRGGAEVLVDGLATALKSAGHRLAVVSLPFKWYPRATLEHQALLWRTLELDKLAGFPVDLVICTKFPTWAVRHPRKIVWLVHQHRQAYDWYGTPLSDFGVSPEDKQARKVVLETDGLGLGEAEKIYTISQNVANRLRKYNGLTGTPLYPPTAHNDFYCREYGDFIFTVSRLDNAKRLDWLLEAMKQTKSTARAIIAGSGPESERLQTKAKSLGISEKVNFVGRISEAEKIEYYAKALAVYYAPIDEDYGYVTVEAMRSSKAVLTSPDSGGVLEFVQDSINGYICHDPSHYAQQIDRLYRDKPLAQTLGRAGLETAKIVPDWQTVANTLIGSNYSPPP